MNLRAFSIFFSTALLLSPAPSRGAALSDVPAPAAATWNVRDHTPLEKFIIQSHRGAGDLAEENTLEAFELGWQMQTYPESDVRTTKDGVIVAFHDNNFARVVKDVPAELAKKGVADLTFDELSKLDVGSFRGEQFKGHHVSRLSEVFAHMTGHPERHLYLDIKNVKLPQLAAEVKAAQIEQQVVLASPKHEIIRQWKALVPESATVLWMSGTEEEKRQKMDAARAANFEGITQIQIHVRLPGDAKDVQPGEPFSPSRAFLREVSAELAARGILFQTLPYGATDPAIYAQLLDAGLASFATDRPDLTWQAVRAYYHPAK